MRPFAYEQPATLADAVALLTESGDASARPLAGGTDLIIRLRDGTLQPRAVIDLKRVAELSDAVVDAGDRLVIGARATMTTLLTDARIVRDHRALAEAAAVVGSVQIRNRATLAGNICNASPAADTAPALLVDDAVVVAVGPAGERRIPIDAFFVRSGVTTLAAGELVTAIELPQPVVPRGTVHVRRTRRRGHDLASVTLACGMTPDGVTRIAYGSLGPRPLLVVDDTGLFADPGAPVDATRRRLDELFVDARPSPRSMRASPAYRRAMLDVLARRAIETARARLGEAERDR